MNAQINTYSPYSYYGLGDLQMSTNTYNMSLGGMGVGLFSKNILNYVNPASYPYLDLTSFEFGIKSSFIRLSESNLSQKNFVSSLHNIGLGFPLSSKIGCSIHLLPYSSVGYSVISNDAMYNNDTEIATTSYYRGAGGINQLTLGLGWQIKPNFSIGLNMHYLFGSIDRETTLYTDNTNLYFTETINNIINGFNPELGLLYTSYINTHQLTAGFTMKPKKTINSKVNIFQSTYEGPVYNEATEYILLNNQGVNNSITLPLECAAGFSISFNEKWMIGLDVNHVSWSNYIDNRGDSYMTNRNKVIFSGSVTPNRGDIYNYFNRVEYRMGISYSQGYINLGETINISQNEIPLKELAFTFGMGLPINKVSSTANIGCKFTKRGYNLSQDFLKEDYFSVYLSMTLNEKLFNKRKIE